MITQNELNKISAFIDSCDDMINGKFILADVKILKILNMIASSEPLYRYIQECLIDFDFSREFSRAEVQNRLNNGNFVPPVEKEKLVAMVFCLLVEFDKKHLDFYSFISNNFATLTPGGEYGLFAKTLLVPFKNIIAEHFGLTNGVSHVEVAPEPVQPQTEEIQEVIEENEPVVEKTEMDKIWDNIPVLVDSLIRTIMLDRKIKQDLKNSLEYILKSIKYSLKYNDMRLVASLVTSFDVLVIKIRSVKFIVEDLKNEIKRYYELARKN